MAETHFLVVGGTRGTGRALVEYLASREGLCVSAFGRSTNLNFQFPNLTQYTVDVSNREALLSCLDQAVARYGKFTCVIFLQRHRADKDDFDTELSVALSATKNAIDHLVEQRHFATADGRTNSIVLVSSVADRYVAPEQSLGYHIAKAGVSQLARYYALTLGSLGIRVNSVSPCIVEKKEAKVFYEKNEWLVDRYKRFVPLGRMGKPQDIINAIMFLASEQASYITGQNIVVDGGLMLRTHEWLLRNMPTTGY